MPLADSPVIQRNLSRAAKVCPNLFWSYMDTNAHRLGLDRLYVILSFDGDTKEDIAAAATLFYRLRQLKLTASLAVPGEQLKEGTDVYRALAKTGVRFLNHGYRPHAQMKEGRYQSVNFYSTMTRADIQEDIQQGHATVQSVTGQPPRGFRTPHFGFFQGTEQLLYLHQILNRMAYIFSSSTMPFYLLTHGAVWKNGNLYEFPHWGSYRAPLTLFDSWSHISKNGAQVDPKYGKTLAQTIERLVQKKARGILNLYADPAHVCGSDDYDQALQRIASYRVPTVHYEDILQLIKR